MVIVNAGIDCSQEEETTGNIYLSLLLLVVVGALLELVVVF
jgi:hypothetical protein